MSATQSLYGPEEMAKCTNSVCNWVARFGGFFFVFGTRARTGFVGGVCGVVIWGVCVISLGRTFRRFGRLPYYLLDPAKKKKSSHPYRICRIKTKKIKIAPTIHVPLLDPNPIGQQVAFFSLWWVEDSFGTLLPI